MKINTIWWKVREKRKKHRRTLSQPSVFNFLFRYYLLFLSHSLIYPCSLPLTRALALIKRRQEALNFAQPFFRT